MAKHRRGPWSSAEDQCLLELVRTQGASNWVRIAQLIQSRSPKQCRERYHQNLKPSLNLDPITAEEGVLIERMVAEMGKRWAEIARRLQGRSDNAVKNWWNGGMNRRKRRDNRRAEMSSTHHTSASHRPQNATAMQSMPPPQQHYDPIFNTHHYRYEHPSASNPLPVPAQNYSSHPRQLQHARHLAEPGVPSPSAVSFVSRTDSSESGPPSLVSDVSGSSYVNSPTSAYPPQEDSRFDYRDPYRRAPPSSYPLNSQYEQYSSPDAPLQLGAYPAAKEYSHPQSSYPLPTDAWRERASKADQDQRVLPNFSTLSAAKSKMSEPSSPPKDDRMKVNALIH